MDPKTFTVATSVSDPLSAQRLVALLKQAEIDAFSRAGGAASSDGFAAAQPGFWDVLVESGSLEKAAGLIASELEANERDAEANAQAADEESLSGEAPVPSDS